MTIPATWWVPAGAAAFGLLRGPHPTHCAGRPIGVLCVISYEPRTFSEAEAELLRFATVVMSLLDLRLHLPQQPTWNP